jgi:hypothetical protein
MLMLDRDHSALGGLGLDGHGAVTALLVGLSDPVQLAWTGVSVYAQCPEGTDCSVQVVVVTIPEHPSPTVALPPLTAS